MNNQLENKKAIIENLKDAGCKNKMISEFLDLLSKKDIRSVFNLLNEYRRTLLEQLHKSQREIDNLDYLIISLKKEERL